MKKIFINLPISNLKETMDFFTKLGFTFNQKFTNENATCMIIEENIYVMFLVEEYFKTFTDKELIDRKTHIGQLLSLPMESKETVDSFTTLALSIGGTKARNTIDMGFMYQKSFNDINNYTWEIFWMDEKYAKEND